MAFTCGFYNGPNRMYNAEQLSSIFDGIISDGMYSNYRNSMIVIESENDSEVIVQPGRAWLMHTWSLVDANLPVEAPQSEVVLDRIDALVIDVNTNPEVKNNEITWVTGTPSSKDPQRPTLLNEEFHKQYPLCYVYRAAGAEHITQENITNAVGTSEFPFVTGIIDTINTDQLILQWEAQWETFMKTYTSEAETWIDTQEGSFLTWSTAQRTAFETWFESIRGILDQDAAGHIMNIIDARIPAYDSENPAQQITAVRSRKGNYISELRVYANAKPRLFQSADGGQTWEDSSVGGFEPVEISYEAYLALTDEEKDAGDWYVVGMPPMGLNAKTIPYSGNVSDAHNVEDAIDKVNQNLTNLMKPWRLVDTLTITTSSTQYNLSEDLHGKHILLVATKSTEPTLVVGSQEMHGELGYVGEYVHLTTTFLPAGASTPYLAVVSFGLVANTSKAYSYTQNIDVNILKIYVKD